MKHTIMMLLMAGVLPFSDVLAQKSGRSEGKRIERTDSHVTTADSSKQKVQTKEDIGQPTNVSASKIQTLQKVYYDKRGNTVKVFLDPLKGTQVINVNGKDHYTEEYFFDCYDGKMVTYSVDYSGEEVSTINLYNIDSQNITKEKTVYAGLNRIPLTRNELTGDLYLTEQYEGGGASSIVMYSALLDSLYGFFPNGEHASYDLADFGYSDSLDVFVVRMDSHRDTSSVLFIREKDGNKQIRRIDLSFSYDNDHWIKPIGDKILLNGGWKLYCLDQSGKIIWEKPDIIIEHDIHVAKSNDLLIIHYPPSKAEDKINSKNISFIDINTGRILWSKAFRDFYPMETKPYRNFNEGMIWNSTIVHDVVVGAKCYFIVSESWNREPTPYNHIHTNERIFLFSVDTETSNVEQLMQIKDAKKICAIKQHDRIRIFHDEDETIYQIK